MCQKMSIETSSVSDVDDQLHKCFVSLLQAHTADGLIFRLLAKMGAPI